MSHIVPLRAAQKLREFRAATATSAETYALVAYIVYMFCLTATVVL